MAQSRSQRMQVVLVLAERQEQAAAERVGAARQQLRAEEEQLSQLQEYAQQYLNAYGACKDNVRAEQLMGYSSFLQRLEQAKNDQQQRLSRVQQQLDVVIGVWQQAYQKRESIKNLIQKLKHEEALLADKRLQKELDELVNQAYSRLLTQF